MCLSSIPFFVRVNGDNCVILAALRWCEVMHWTDLSGHCRFRSFMMKNYDRVLVTSFLHFTHQSRFLTCVVLACRAIPYLGLVLEDRESGSGARSSVYLHLSS